MRSERPWNASVSGRNASLEYFTWNSLFKITGDLNNYFISTDRSGFSPAVRRYYQNLHELTSLCLEINETLSKLRKIKDSSSRFTRVNKAANDILSAQLHSETTSKLDTYGIVQTLHNYKRTSEQLANSVNTSDQSTEIAVGIHVRFCFPVRKSKFIYIILMHAEDQFRCSASWGSRCKA